MLKSLDKLSNLWYNGGSAKIRMGDERKCTEFI